MPKNLDTVFDRTPDRARLLNGLRAAERDWAQHAAFDGHPDGNPWAAQRDAAAARYDAIKAQIAECKA